MHPFQRHQTVYYQNPDKPGWNPGRITDRISDRSYDVEGETGGTYTRNRVHLRPKHTPFKSRIQVDDDVMPAEDTTMEDDNCQWRYSQLHVPQNGRAAHPTRPAVELPHSPQTDESKNSPPLLDQRSGAHSDTRNTHITRSGRVVRKPDNYTL